MKFQIFSDLHITDNNILPNISPTADYLILAGDIGKITDKNYVKFLNFVNSNWKLTFYILGNHEFYNKKYTMKEMLESYKYFFKRYKNIKLLYNKTFELGDYLIVGTTLWSYPDIKDFTRPLLSNTKKGKVWDLKKYLKFSDDCKEFLKTIKTKKKVILITHFPLINKYTFNEKHQYGEYLTWLTNNYDIKKLRFYKQLNTVISGHTHFSYDFYYKKVRFISNQFGYLSQGNQLCKLNGMFKIT